MTNINGLNNYNYKLQQQWATMPQAQQVQMMNYLNGTGATDEVIFNTVNNDGNYCTDGKDDGKIGFFSALGNATQGVGKTVVNGIKGMFTGADGKFSVLKTIGSVAMAATCIAFPAVGLAACAVGGVMGAVEVGKGIHNAATAETDAEAKAAWENIGGGTFTVASSVVGAKASYNAVQKTSTAANGLTSLKNNPNATLGQKAVALGNDMKSSTANNFTTLKSSVTAKYGNIMNDANNAKQTLEAKVKTVKNKHQSASTPENQNSPQADLYKLADKTKNTKNGKPSQVDKFNARAAKADPNRTTTSTTNAGVKAQQQQNAIIKETQAPTAKPEVANKKIGFKEIIGKTETGKALNGLKTAEKGTKFASIKNGLTADGQAILAALNKGVPPESLIAKYGYESVAQVINTAVGSSFADQAI